MKKSRYLRIIFVVLIVCLIIANIFIFAILFRPSGTDAEEYATIARNLVDGHGFSLEVQAPYFPTMYREPVYPYFLAGHFWLFGKYADIMIVADQTILLLLTTFLVFKIFSSIGTKTMATAAAVLLLLFPPLVHFAGQYLSEMLMTFLLAASLYSFIRSEHTQRTSYYLITGLLFGLSVLTKTIVLFFPFFLLGVVWYFHGLNLKKLFNYGLILLVFLMTITPWMARNYLIFKTPALTLRAGQLFYNHALKAEMTPNERNCYFLNTFINRDFIIKKYPTCKIDPWPARTEYFKLKNQNFDDVAIDRILMQRGLNLFFKSPLSYLEYSLVELWKFNIPGMYIGSGYDQNLSGIMSKWAIPKRFHNTILIVMFVSLKIIFLIILIGMLIGLIRSIQHPKKIHQLLPIILLIVYFNGIHAIMDAINRYSLPIIPYYLFFWLYALFESKLKILRNIEKFVNY